MLGVDALSDEDQAPDQKKSVSPSVKRHARGSVSSSPGRALPMKCSLVRVGTHPSDAQEQKKSVSPSVKRHAGRSVSSSPARALPMKCSVVRVGKNPSDA